MTPFQHSIRSGGTVLDEVMCAFHMAHTKNCLGIDFRDKTLDTEVSSPYFLKISIIASISLIFNYSKLLKNISNNVG
jgi:hypothetical protein